MTEIPAERPRGGRADQQATLAASGICIASDPSLHEHAIKPWELLTRPAAPGPFRHEMRYLSTPGLCVYEERFLRAVRLRGQSPPGVLALGIPIRSTPGTTCWKAPLSPAAMPAALDDALDAVLGTGHRQLVVLVAVSLVERELGAERAALLERLCRSRHLPSSEPRVAHLRSWLLRLLEAVGRSPGLLQQPAALRSMEADLLQRIAAAVRFPPEESLTVRSPVSGRGGHFSRALAGALDFLYSEDAVDLTIPVLCEAIGVGQRTLEYAFREAFDLSPSGFLRLRHLHAARSRLMAADRSQMAVVDIAYQEGFYHLGRFAALYRRTFGELPSQTLKRPCPPRLRDLMAAPPLRVAKPGLKLLF